MSMQFDNPLDGEQLKHIREMFGQTVVSEDKKKVLFTTDRTIKSRDMTKLANANGGPVRVDLHGKDEIVELGEDRYQVTPDGWKKL